MQTWLSPIALVPILHPLKTYESASLCRYAQIGLAVVSGFQSEVVSERAVLWCQLQARCSSLDQFEVDTGKVEHLVAGKGLAL